MSVNAARRSACATGAFILFGFLAGLEHGLQKIL